MEVETVIKNCILVNHDGLLPAGLALDQGRIVAIAGDDDLPRAKKTIDAGKKYVLPGLVDAHFHLQYPPGVDPEMNIQKETQACAISGVTSIIHLLAPSDDIVAEAGKFINLYEKNAYVDLALSARIYTRDHIKQIEGLYNLGISGIKLLLPYKGSEAVWKGRAGGIDDGIVYLTFKEIGRLAALGNKVFARVHCENVEIFLQMKAEFLENQGGEPASWNAVRTRVCEEESMRKCLFLAQTTGCPVYIVHMTVKEGIPLVRAARAQGQEVFAETCVQYLTANTGNVDRILSKVNPPIRESEDNDRLWAALRDGVIDVVATDHAPVPKALKQNLWEAMVGMPMVEMFLPLMLSEGVNNGKITLPQLVETCCYNPARIFNFAPKKGTISIGSDADLVMVDLEKEVVVPSSGFYTNSDISIFAGRKIKGWPIMTLIRGEVVSDAGKLIGQAGYGRYIPALDGRLQFAAN